MIYAVYAEFEHADDSLFQFLFIPSVPLGTGAVDAILFFRKLTEDHPRRVWSTTRSVSYVPPREAVPRDVSTEAIMKEALAQLHSASSAMMSVIVDPAYTLRGAFPVLVQPSDSLALMDNPSRVPPLIADRIRTQRELAALPALPGRTN